MVSYLNNFCYLSVVFNLFFSQFQEQQSSSPVADRKSARPMNRAVLSAHVDDFSCAGTCPAEAFERTANNFMALFNHGVRCAVSPCCRDFCWKVKPIVKFYLQCKERNISSPLADQIDLMCYHHAMLCKDDECDSFACRYFKKGKEDNDSEHLECVRKWNVYFERISRDVNIYNDMVDDEIFRRLERSYR